jgi:hypothetical protein
MRVSQKYKLLGTLFIFRIACKIGPLIFVPGASLSAGLALSLLAALGVCGVSPVQLIPQESSRLERKSTLFFNHF